MVRHLAALESMACWICPEVESTVRFNGAGSGAVPNDVVGEQEVRSIKVRIKIFFMDSPGVIKKVPVTFRQRERFSNFYYGVAVAVGVDVEVAVEVGVAEGGKGVFVGVFVTGDEDPPAL